MSISSLCGSGTPSVSNIAAPGPAVTSGPSVAEDTRRDYFPSPGERADSPRLLYLASTQSQGGIERHSGKMAKALHDRGKSIQFACSPGSYLDLWCRTQNIPTLPFQVRNSGDLSAAYRLAALIRDNRIDVIHVHSRRDYLVAVLGVQIAKLFFRSCHRLILHAHMIRPLGSPAHMSGKFFEWGADAVVAVSASVCDHLRRAHDFHPAFVHLIYNGIPLAEFARPGTIVGQAQRREARRSWAIPDSAIALGMIGRLDAKGQAALLRVIPSLVERHPDLRVVLVGGEGRPGEEELLRRQAQDAGIAARLTFTGEREDVPALLPAFDVLIHLPQDESFGLALAEAMAVGLPVVATDIGGCREVVRDGVTGLLVPPGDTEALRQALLALLDPKDGQERRTALGQAGRRVVEANFSQEHQIQLLQELYSPPDLACDSSQTVRKFT